VDRTLDKLATRTRQWNASGFRHTVRLAATDPDWGWLLVHLDVSPPIEALDALYQALGQCVPLDRWVE
jgi:hypothetical protein